MKTLEERYRELLESIKQAEIVAGLRKTQLDELRPKRQEYETFSNDNFGVPAQKINEFIITQEEKGEKLINELEQELAKAKQVT
jgi:uncharacterized protein YlaN (UPF0358 family)